MRRELSVGPLCASSTARRADAKWSPPRPAPSYGVRQSRQECGVASRRISFAHHAVEMARDGVPLTVIQRQLWHSNLGITSVDLQGIDSGEIIETVHSRRTPMISG
jgi:hypothetical protein